MLEASNCYKKLTKSVVLLDLIGDPANMPVTSYMGWKISKLSLDSILSEPLLHDINKEFKIIKGGVTRLDPHRCYRWHKDEIRGVSINMLIKPVDNLVLFGVNSKGSIDQFDTIRLDYDPGTFYLFNNQEMHTVINFSETRYLLSLEFEKNKNDLSFQDISKLF